ncbi:unnamed protein product [Rotaria sordida]|uniref:Peptidase C1A papain C-terminal domain-containing protein n=1 Tax=Rotaria sordida TaxID=392033 RepID=A0A818MEA5_9BILA|nr:unnamed protein product [Rotaria sordida]CAF3940443.1 unnamed protein product [Rotaria sordida]
MEAMTARVELNEMRGCLAEAYPFAFGLRLFPSFAQAGSNGGRVQMPNIHYESQSAEQGCHAMLAVGYSDLSGCFIVRNSWGEKWDKITLSSTFHIICRGYYKDEDKNPLHLLRFLSDNSLSHVPVLVFTHDKSGLLTHLQSEAPSMAINDWKQRLFITGNHEELIKNIKEKIANKQSSNK